MRITFPLPRAIPIIRMRIVASGLPPYLNEDNLSAFKLPFYPKEGFTSYPPSNLEKLLCGK